eukprot:8245882-Pyramimonas_sp.AAC.1
MGGRGWGGRNEDRETRSANNLAPPWEPLGMRMGRGPTRVRMASLRALSRRAHTSTATQRFPEPRRFST